jgi:hypothetical protein
MKPARWFTVALRKLNTSRRERPLLFWLRVATVLGVVVLFAVKRNFWTPDTLFIVLLALFVVLGQARAFVVRFAPFVLLLLAYDSFRGIADDLNKNVHFWEMIHADRLMFGGALPTDALQQWWWHGTVQWYDFYFYFLYTIHFLAPVLLAVLLWKLRPKLYWPFVGALVGLSFAAFVTYVLFPAAPPWMASDLGYIEPIHRISSDIWAAMGVENFSQVYANLSPNPVAAVPSLHSAYPLLFVMFLVRAFGWRRAGWLYIYPASMWIGVTYLGEHYVIDAILGALYAVGAYFASMWFFAWARQRDWQFAADYQRGHEWAYQRVRNWRD